MKADAASLLEKARHAYAQRAWADAFALLQATDAIAPLGPDDLERQLWSAAMLDRDQDSQVAGDRLFEAYVEAGRYDRAAYWAFFRGFRLLALGEEGHATACIQQAQRLADGFGRECAAHGYLILLAAQKELMTGNDPAAAPLASQALAIGERCCDIDLVAFARCYLGRALVRQGRIDEGIASLDEAMLPAVDGKLSPIVTGLIYCNLIAACRQVYALDRSREWTEALSNWCGTQPQLVQFNGVCLLHRAEIMELNGAWQDAIAEARRATTSLAHTTASEAAAGAAYQEAEIHRLRGEFAAAEDLYRTASRLGLEPQPGMALLRLAQGRAEQAAATLRRVLATTKAPLGRARLLPALVEIMIAAGAIEEARDACQELEAIASRFATDILAAMASQARGEIDLHEGSAATALGHFRAALTTWQRAGAPYLEARLRVLAGQACRMLGDEDGTELEFDAARTVFAGLGAAPDLARVAALTRPTSLPSHGLTRREIEVLGLVATGKTNRTIATDLGLSEKTVDRHLSNIFDKLAVNSRAAATAYGFQNGLL
ncbi:helix-turn-helix transcriptional regulator [Mesorhizobium sp. M4B.F.Ca.ET.215.01.1.1]|uniref:helix-turn-helix transcriptional regulator n=1 Tax=Mesorhizobium TaxID=68287 RepID=UPI000FCCCC57|nr:MULTISPECIES: helix-turn-helix transcriptional regulator [unclassified Mesorhizobium]RVD37006.1 helix-turn-helix transcriptional regulator [Mesorhizobium sp. M4B.F.Ca.ET.019.03.1.1]RWA65758.1 MAG: helix-turn-helix transcriptional regulator [Mesorhizobium sp.]TGQ11072.1 helix-turn-helix transcriptional regulator [Mesorhizobium sp. M4B.F.Ca.ET.215.01.1.1]TGQ38903.1 helix-turn-helix transcriptional regulator [Mesorhizobium sp. M4B.F.Ca.ET.214.01.1.1]TGQ44920.1 helix-turn-helix transcriptional 